MKDPISAYEVGGGRANSFCPMPENILFIMEKQFRCTWIPEFCLIQLKESCVMYCLCLILNNLMQLMKVVCS